MLCCFWEKRINCSQPFGKSCKVLSVQTFLSSLFQAFLDPSRACDSFSFNMMANSMCTWWCASHVLVVLLVCFVTSLFALDYFYWSDFVLLKAMLTFAILKQIPLMNWFENMLAYDQLKSNHHWHAVGAWWFFMHALHDSWSRFMLRGGGRWRLRSSQPHVAPRLMPCSTMMASALAGVKLTFILRWLPWAFASFRLIMVI